MANKEVYVGDVGTELSFDIGVDGADVSSAIVYYIKPSGKKGSWVATPVSGETRVYYVVVSGDLDESGTYQLQLKVTLSSGWSGYSTPTSLNVISPIVKI
jgi:hypothetical protein